MLDKLEIYISVIAALLSAAFSIYLGATLFEMSVRMITMIISFYIIGQIVKLYLKKKVFPEPEKPDDPANENDDSITAAVSKDGDTDDDADL